MSRENFKILVVDDEQSFLLLLSKILKAEGYAVTTTNSPEKAIELSKSLSPNLVITDLKMPGIDGITMMRLIGSGPDFLVITAYAEVDTAVEAMKLGAVDYITKPLKSPEELRKTVFNIYERQRLRAENEFLKSTQVSEMPPLDVVFADMHKVLKDIQDVAPTNATVIIYGETGTGKSLIARVIHYLSQRRGPFVDINCAAIPENLLESELFGYEKGAFTGATSQKKGKFELADDGTIFLDEVSEMSLALQAKFLKILQEKSFERLGSVDTIKTNARVIAATNRDLKQMVAEKRFREDLYYRLNVFPIHLPPLRERKTALPKIADYLAKSLSARLGKPTMNLDELSMQRLRDYHWPGNIRELENVIERAIIVSKGQYISIPELDGSEGFGSTKDIESLGSLQELEKTAIEKTLALVGGNRRQAAQRLGISLRTLQYKIKEYGLS